MCYTRRKTEGGVSALRESDDTNVLKPNGQSRNLKIYGTHLGYVIFESDSANWFMPSFPSYKILPALI